MKKPPLTQFAYLSGLTDSQLSDLEPLFQPAVFSRHDDIYRAGQPAAWLYFLAAGVVELSMNLTDPAGQEKSLLHLQAGDSFGIGEIFFTDYYLNARAVTAVETWRVDKAAALDRLLALPAVNRRILEDFAFMTKVNTLTPNWNTARERLLLLLTNAAGPGSGTVTLGPDLTVTALSERLDLTREHVSRLVAGLIKDGVVAKDGHRLVVDRLKLEAQLAIREFSGKIRF